MRKEIAEKWVAALRSGEYGQITGGLANVDRSQHCCLGVLCELAIEDGVSVYLEPDHPTHASWMRFDNLLGALPESVGTWAGMTISKGRVLAAMNDAGEPFVKIADAIESDWEEL